MAGRKPGGWAGPGRRRLQRIELRLSRGRTRLIRQNGVRRSSSEVTESLKAVLFSPEDLGLVRGPASGRRKLLDSAISQLRPGYGALLADYARLYENKLRILRDWREKPSLLDPLEEFSRSLCLYSARLIRYRASFAARLAALAGPHPPGVLRRRGEAGDPVPRPSPPSPTPRPRRRPSWRRFSSGRRP